MVKNEVENLCFNEKGNYQQKEERRNKERWEGKKCTLLLCVKRDLA
jgi:hypothetical protein